MMIGNSPTNIAQVLLLVNWLLEADFKRKFKQLSSNKVFWALVSLYLAHVVGLIYTNDLNAGLNDVRAKIPLLLAPLVFFSSGRLTLKEFYNVLYCFLLGCFVNTAWCLTYNFALHQNEAMRNASRFMSHIRLGMFLNMAIVCCVYFVYKTEIFSRKLIFSLLGFYFLFALLALGLASGLTYFMVLLFFGSCVFVYRQKPMVKLILVITIVLIAFLCVNYISETKNSQLIINQSENNKIQNKNRVGNPYIHYDSTGHKENGNYVFINIQPEELQRVWNRLCPEDSFNYRPPVNLQRYEVLLRYLASKSLNKDSLGIAKLSRNDIQNIKQNVPNYLYPEWGFLHRRIYEMVNEYDDYAHNREVNGHSITMRFYFWKASLKIIKNNFLLGVGTGDVQTELNRIYSSEFPLSEEWYKRPHNQFLTITVALGVVGLLIFLIGILYPVLYLRKYFSPLFWPFLLVAVLSFFTEDTLETMAGMSFYGIWNTIFVSMAWFKKQQNPAD